MLQSQPLDILIVRKLKNNLGVEASAVAEFLVLLQELDNSRGWARLGYASLFDFCHLNLNLTRAEAYSRTRLARLAGDVPQVISLLKTGEVSLSALRILAPVLTVENVTEVLAAIRGKTTREVEDFRNAFRPGDKPAVRGVVRTIFSVDKTAVSAAPVTVPVAAAHQPLQKSVRMSFTLSEELWNKYQRACNLSNHRAAGGDVAEVMEMLLDDYLKRRDVMANAKPEGKHVQHKQANHSRYIPKKFRIEVRQRDLEQCSYVDSATGRRCDCRRGLQYDHIKPFALGGASGTSENLRLLCRAHNRLAAENIFGAEFISSKIQNATRDLGR
jgi:hypothetical protein